MRNYEIKYVKSTYQCDMMTESESEFERDRTAPCTRTG